MSTYSANTKTLYNATIITLNQRMDILEKGYLIIKDDKIIALGSGTPSHMENPINLEGKIIIPGFVNAHTHMPMTLYRGIADDLPLKEWLEEHIWPAEAKLTFENNVRVGARIGLAEMIKTGTSTFCDMYFFADAVAEETEKAGLRAVMGEGILEFPTNSFDDSTKALEKAENFIKKWQNHPLIVPGTIFHATYTCKKETLKKVKQMAEKYNTPLTTHISETQEEVETVCKEQGLNPVQYLDSLGLLNKHMTGAHCVWLTDQDQDLFAKNGTSVAHCPTSNLKLASGIAPIPSYIEKGINVALGTDGTASNNNLDMVEEMRLAALIHKGNNLNATVVNAQTALKMATINGAKALGLDDKIGSIEVGKLADLQIIDTNNSFMTPIYDYYSAIVYSMNSHCIESLLINGKPVMIERELQTIDEQKTLKEIREITER